MSERLLYRTLFRQTSPLQMQTFFRRFGYEIKVEPLPKRTLPRRIQNITPFVEAYNALTSEIREEMDRQIEDISALATARGMEIVEQLVEEYKYIPWRCFRPTDSNYHRIVDIWLNQRDMFDRALEIFRS